MKHVKLFEAFGASTPIIKAEGDWSGILRNPTPENVERFAQFIAPSIFVVNYIENPSPSEIEEVNSDTDLLDTPQENPHDRDEAMEEIFGGDQNGVSIHGGSKFFISPDISVEKLEAMCNEQINVTNLYPSEEDFADAILDDENLMEYTPAYVQYLKGIVDGNYKPLPRKLIFNKM